MPHYGYCAVEWNVEKGPRKCFQCESLFKEGSEYYSALLDKGSEFERHDYCFKCWDESSEGSGWFSFWKTKIPQKEEQRRLLADDDVLWDFFLRLENDPDPSRQQFCYLLSLILMRKKLLKFEDIEKQDGKEYLILRQPKENRFFQILNPHLTEEQLDEVKEQMGQILDMSL